MKNQNLKLIAPLGYPRANAIKITSQICNIPLELENINWQQLEAPEFLQKNPMGTVPVLETDNGTIHETNAILRYLSRVAPQNKLYGQSHFESGKVDQYLDMINIDISPAVFALVGPVYGWLEFEQNRYEQAFQDLEKIFQIINNSLLLQTYLVGNQLTLADISMFATLCPLFKFILSPEKRKNFSNLTRWFTNLANQQIFIQHYGKQVLANSEWKLEAKQQQSQPNLKPKQNHDNKQKQQKQQQQPKKEEKKEVKKEEKQVEKKVEDEYVSPFDLYDYKTQITNAKDKNEVIQFLFDNFDPKAFSLYYMEYDRYEGEGIKLHLTSNLKDSTLQRLDGLRKFGYGNFGVYGNEGDYEIYGVFLWKSTEIHPAVKDLPSYEYHKFRKLDINNADDKKLIIDSWTGLDLDTSVVNNRIARDVTVFR